MHGFRLRGVKGVHVIMDAPRGREQGGGEMVSCNSHSRGYDGVIHPIRHETCEGAPCLDCGTFSGDKHMSVLMITCLVALVPAAAAPPEGGVIKAHRDGVFAVTV